MKCEVCNRSDHDGLYDNGALKICRECDAHLCEYCAETTEYPLIPIQNDAGYIAQVCPVCTLETAVRIFDHLEMRFETLDEIRFDLGCKFVNLAIKSLKGE